MAHERLISLRKEKGFSQGELAEYISMEQTTYSRKERGISVITQEEWERLASVLGVTVEDIKDEERLVMKNENCTFNDHSIGLQHVNVPKEVLNMIVRYNEKLEQENIELRKKLENNN